MVQIKLSVALILAAASAIVPVASLPVPSKRVENSSQLGRSKTLPSIVTSRWVYIQWSFMTLMLLNALPIICSIAPVKNPIMKCQGAQLWAREYMIVCQCSIFDFVADIWYSQQHGSILELSAVDLNRFRTFQNANKQLQAAFKFTQSKKRLEGRNSDDDVISAPAWDVRVIAGGDWSRRQKNWTKHLQPALPNLDIHPLWVTPAECGSRREPTKASVGPRLVTCDNAYIFSQHI